MEVVVVAVTVTVANTAITIQAVVVVAEEEEVEAMVVISIHIKHKTMSSKIIFFSIISVKPENIQSKIRLLDQKLVVFIF